MRRVTVVPGRALAVLALAAGVGLVVPAVSLAAPVDHVVVGVSNHSPGVGAMFTVTAVAKTASGLTDKSFSGPASWSDKSGHLTPGSPSDFVDGVSRTTGVAVSAPFHSDTIAVSSGGLSGTSGAVDVLGPLARFSFTPELHKQAINTSFTVKISAHDAAGNLLTGYAGSPSWFDSSGSLSYSSPAAFIGGVSTTTTAVADPYHLDKIIVDDASAGVQSSSHAFNVLGPFDHFSFSKIPQSLAVNQPFTLVVRAVDSAGNIVTGYTGSPGWDDNSSSLSPSAPAPFVDGVSVNRCTTVGSTQANDLIGVYDNGAGVTSTSPDFDVTDSQDFTTPGTYTFTVPCAASIGVSAWGAAGGGTPYGCGSTPGGEGAFVGAGLTVSAGEQLTAGVGGAGGDACSNTGGSGGTGSGANGGAGGSAEYAGAGGGGASFLSTGTGTGAPTTSSLLLIAGGGGGAGSGVAGGNADSAGVPQPPNCPNPGDNIACGGGAGSSPGGKGGANGGGADGSDGGFLAGGPGGGSTNGNGRGGGGGGSGYYGGGGGGGASGFPGSGGGGQSFITSSATNTSGPTPTSGMAEVSITYAPPT
jgi:hypothetical protein